MRKKILIVLIVIIVVSIFILILQKNKSFTYEINNNEVTITGLTDHGKTLSKLVIPDHIKGRKVRYIGLNAFEYNDNIQEAEIPATVQIIEGGAFYGCQYLKKVNILGKTDIENMAFLGCKSLCEFNLSERGITIESMSFNDTGLSNIDEILQSIEVVSQSLFLDCINIQKVVIPDNVKKIKTNAFGRCYSLKEIVIPDSVEELEEGIFWMDENVTIITSSGSAAEQYAIDYNIPYVIRDDL